MRNGSKYTALFVFLAFACFSNFAMANNSVSLIRTPVSVQKSHDFCFQQQGLATAYAIYFAFGSTASGTVSVDGTLMDSFPPAGGRSTTARGMFKSGVHKITLIFDNEATVTRGSVTAYGTGGDLNLFPVLSCSGSRKISTSTSQNNNGSANLAAINKKLNDLEVRVAKLESLVEGKQESKQQAGTAKAEENETLDQKLARLQKEATAMSNLGTALLKNADEWKKEINTLRTSSK